jgi:branched-chain amino acid transport system substrate-binding protein
VVIRRSIGISVALVMLSAAAVAGEKKYGPGVTDTEIKIGNTAAYSGPASGFGLIARTSEAYFHKINDEGGINGRKIVFLSYDDAYSPPKTVEQTRKLVEGDEVLLMFNAVGTPTNSAVQKYLNIKKVPQLFVSSAAAKWNDPKNFPWSIGFAPSYKNEGRIYAKYLLKEKPNGKIAIFFQNDDFGKDYLRGIKEGLGDKAASMIVAEESFDVTEPTIDSHIVKLKASGADVFLDIATPKFAAQAIKKVSELEWKPLHILSFASTSIGGVIKPAGVENAQGIISATYFKDSNNPRWKDDPGFKAFDAFLEKYLPEANHSDTLIINAYNPALLLVQVLKQCGDDLTRENVMKQAASLKDVELGMLLPGSKVNTSPTDYAPVKQWHLMRFEGENWQLFGDLVSGEGQD